MNRLLATAVFALFASLAAAQEGAYFPGAWPDWQSASPEEVSMHAERLDQAVRFAQQNFGRDGGFDPSREPYGETVGPTKSPSGMNGLVLVGGRRSTGSVAKPDRCRGNREPCLVR